MRRLTKERIFNGCLALIFLLVCLGMVAAYFLPVPDNSTRIESR
jgi:hypothetical protein